MLYHFLTYSNVVSGDGWQLVSINRSAVHTRKFTFDGNCQQKLLVGTVLSDIAFR